MFMRISVALFKSDFSVSIFLVPFEHSLIPKTATLNLLAESCLVLTAGGVLELDCNNKLIFDVF